MITDIITKYKEKKFLIAYSGGMDSTVLLYEMMQIKKKIPNIKIRAIHINHNLHETSVKWVKHCIQICQKYKISLIIKNIANNLHQNSENQLRIKRYNCIYKSLLINEILLTGHHLNDQCETLILSLKRGSGPTGLSGMSKETIFGKTKIVRPFLNKMKKELEKIAYTKKLEWIEDFSNCNINYDRNFIRNKIIPIFEKRWPFFLRNCFRTATICQEETNLIKIILKKKINNFINYDKCLNISKFEKIPIELSFSIIRYWISLQKIQMLSYKLIRCIYNEIIFSKKDANPKIIIKNNEIRRYKNILYFIKTKPILNNFIIFWHNHKKKLILPNDLGYIKKNYINEGIILPAPKKNQLINIRFQFEGKILIFGRNKKRKIKKIWQEHNIPPWIRNQIPLLFYDNYFISALGVFIVNNVQNIDKNNTYKKFWNISWINQIKKVHKNYFSFY